MLSWCQTGKQHFWSSSSLCKLSHTLRVKAVFLPWIWNLIVQENCLGVPWVWGIMSTKIVSHYYYTLLLSLYFLPPVFLPAIPSNSLGSSFFFPWLPVFQRHFPKHLEQLCQPSWPLARPNSTSLEPQEPSPASPGLGTPESPLAAFPLSKACRSWLKVAGMVMVSQDQRCSSAPACLQLSPSSRCSCSIPSEARPWPSSGLCRDLSAFLQLWPGGDRLNSYSECIYSKQTPLACCCLMHIPAAPTVHLIKN